MLQKLILIFNYLAALLLFFTFFVPIIPADKYTFFSILGLFVPFLITLNIALVIYWLIKRKKFFLISASLLLLGYFLLQPIYKFNRSSIGSLGNELSIMTFNTRDFDIRGSLGKENVDSLILDFVTKEDADIVCFQEFHHAMKHRKELKQYPYQFVDFIYGKNSGRVIQAIYSKYPILQLKLIEFPKSANSALYADIVMKKDTIRIYNLHLQSFKISPEVSTIKNQDSKRLVGRLSKVLKLQKEQADIIKDHYNNTNYKKILVGDFNNTQFSNIYRIVKGDFQDSFVEAGEGFGRTYDLKGMPLRIDYILADDSFEVLGHQNYDVKLSDHYPVKATLRIKE